MTEEEKVIYNKNLNLLRIEIDTIDQKILNNLIERNKVSEKIGILKKQNGINKMSIERQTEIINQLTPTSQFIKKIYLTIFENSINIQNQIIKNYE